MGLLVSATEAAFLCGCNDRTIRRAIERGTLKAQDDGPRRTRPADGEHPRAVGPSKMLIDSDTLAAAGLVIIPERWVDMLKRRATPERVQELAAENAELRATIARLEAANARQTHQNGQETEVSRSDGVQHHSRAEARPLHAEGATSQEPVTRSRPSNQRRSRQSGQGWYHGSDGGNYGEADGLLTKGYINALVMQHHGAKDYGRKTLVDKMPTETRQSVAAALRWLFAHYSRMERCAVTDCPCQSSADASEGEDGIEQ